MMKSMTAFSSAGKTANGMAVKVEIRSYNSRNLDLLIHLPHGYISLEEKIRGCIGKFASRGRIGVRIDFKDETETALSYRVDVGRAVAYHQALHQLKDVLNLDDRVTLDLVLGGEDIIVSADVDTDPDACWEAVSDCLQDALASFDAMRRREGTLLADDLADRLRLLERCINEIESGSANLIDRYRERLAERIGELTQHTIDLDPDRVTQEAAFLADKSDISEEIVRIRSHIKQFAETMNGDEPAGRKLNFLLQEFNREFNTIGSKTTATAVAHRVVDAKAEVEKMREQVQNVE